MARFKKRKSKRYYVKLLSKHTGNWSIDGQKGYSSLKRAVERVKYLSTFPSSVESLYITRK